MRKLILILFMIVGCSQIETQIIESKIIPFDNNSQAVEIREVKDLIAIKDDIELIQDMDIDFRFYKGVTINDFCNALSYGLPELGFMVDFISPEDKYIIPGYKGKLKDLFKLLQEAYGFSYFVNGNNIIIKDNCQVILKVPSVISGKEKDIKDMMSIFNINADDIHIDSIRGVVVAIMNAQQYKYLKKYLHDYGIYQYQIDIAVIEDTSTKTKTVGVDLSRVGAAISNQMPVGTIKAIGNTLSLLTSPSGVAAVTIGINNFLALDTVIAAYGSLNEIRLDQRIKMGVLSGSVAHVDLSRKIPYVSQITAVSGQTGGAQTGYTFDTAQDGLVIDIKPSGDDESINLSTSINYQQITSYLEVGVGEYKISRPIVQARSYKAEYCMRPGEVTLIGSLRIVNDELIQKGILDNKTYSDKNMVVRDLSILMGVSVVKYKMI
jgi:hypothetical protein